MTLLLDLSATAQLIKTVGIEKFLLQLTATLAADYARWDKFQHRPRLAFDAEVNHKPVGVLELMPAFDGETFTFKYVNGHPPNTAMGKLSVVAFGALADAATGYPQLIAEMTLLTALRTAATSALAAQYAMRTGATRHAIIGTGAQAEFQVLAMAAVNGLHDVVYFDKDPAAMAKFAENMKGYPYLRLQPTQSVGAAVAEADVITTATATKGRSEIVPANLLRAGLHFNAIGGDAPGKTEFMPNLVQQCRVLVEYEPQTRHEGELQQLPPDFPVVTLAQLAQGQAQARHHDSDITFYDSVGYALEDFSALSLVLQLATQNGAGQRLALVPTMADPKNLFSLLQ